MRSEQDRQVEIEQVRQKLGMREGFGVVPTCCAYDWRAVD